MQPTSFTLPMNMLVGMALSLSVLSACRKDRDVQGGGSGASYLSLSIDSACIQAPNVFTPNSDGVNDALWIAYRNITTTEVTVRNSAGDTLFHTTDPNTSWDGSNATSVGPFTVRVTATTTSGATLQGQNYVSKLSYGTGNCLQFSGNPVTGDQFDPRHCGLVYSSNEVFCD